jgi:hypothetical protein
VASVGSANAIAAAIVPASPPTITQAASSSQPTSSTLTLTMAASSEDPLAYSWQVVSTPSGAAAPQIDNDEQQTADVTLQAAGNYVFEGTATDEATGLSTTSDVPVNVIQQATSVSVLPYDYGQQFGYSYTVAIGSVGEYVATELDQFGNAMQSQPTPGWSIADPTLATFSPFSNDADVIPTHWSVGSTAITATEGSISGTAPVFVDATAEFDNVEPWNETGALPQGTIISTQNPEVVVSSPRGQVVSGNNTGVDWLVYAGSPSASSAELDLNFPAPVNDLYFSWLPGGSVYNGSDEITVQVYTSGGYAGTVTNYAQGQALPFQQITSVDIVGPAYPGAGSASAYSVIRALSFQYPDVGVALGDGSANQILQASDDGTQNLVPLQIFAPSNLPNGTVLTLSTTAADEVDVWDNANPSADDTPLLGGDGSTSQTTWTVGTDTIPTTLYVGAPAASQTVGNISFILAALLPGASESASPVASSTQPSAATQGASAINLDLYAVPGAHTSPDNGKTFSIADGAQVNPTAELSGPAQLTTGTYSWTVDGNPLSGTDAYDESLTKGTATNPFVSTNTSSPVFEWASAGTGRNVTCTFTNAAGKTYTQKVTFNVLEPTATFASSTWGPGNATVVDPVLGPYAAYGFQIQWGNLLSGVSANPALGAAQGAGQIRMVQLAEFYTATTENNVFTIRQNQGYQLDTVAGTVNNWPTTNLPAGGAVGLPDNWQDFPSIPSAINSMAIMGDSFDTYLQYLPPGVGSIWVTISKMKWNFFVIAGKDVDTGLFEPLLPPIQSENPQGVNSSEIPEWLGHAQVALNNPKQFPLP